MEISNNERELVAEKLGGVVQKLLVDFDEGVKFGRVTVDKDSRWGYVVSFNMWLPRKYQIYAKSHEKSVALAVGKVKDQLYVELEKYLSLIATHQL